VTLNRINQLARQGREVGRKTRHRGKVGGGFKFFSRSTGTITRWAISKKRNHKFFNNIIQEKRTENAEMELTKGDEGGVDISTKDRKRKAAVLVRERTGLGKGRPRSRGRKGPRGKEESGVGGLKRKTL